MCFVKKENQSVTYITQLLIKKCGEMGTKQTVFKNFMLKDLYNELQRDPI